MLHSFKIFKSPGDPGGFFRLFYFIFPLFFIFIGTSSAWVESPIIITEKDLGDSLSYLKCRHPNTGEFHLTKVKCTSEKWRVSPVINQKKIISSGTVKELAVSADKNAIAAINASFFDEAKFPIGTVAINGQIVSLDNRERTSLGITNDGRAVMDLLKPRAFISADDYFEPVWIWGYNHSFISNAIIAYNIHSGNSSIAIPSNATALSIVDSKVESIQASGSIAITDKNTIVLFHGKSKKHLERFPEGTSVTLGLVMPKEWKNVSSMVTGGPRIIENGRSIDLKKKTEGFPSSIFKPGRRTITGITWNNEVFFAVFPQAVTYESAAEVLLEMNVKEAMGLDGGSSTSFWVKNITSFNTSKKVPVALAILPAGETQELLPWFENKYW